MEVVVVVVVDRGGEGGGEVEVVGRWRWWTQEVEVVVEVMHVKMEVMVD